MSIVQNALVTGLGIGENSYTFPSEGGRPFVATPAAADAIAYGPAYGTPNAANAVESESVYGGSSSGSTGLGNFGTIMNGVMNALYGALGSLSSLFGTSSSSGSSGSSSPSWQATPVSGSIPQQYYTSATASSVGDPHDAFSGTTARGAKVGDTWNDMNGRPNLLESDSFAGGYRISTTDTSPQSNGVTYNASATVATDFGATNVTMQANGSYCVTEHGQNVTLTQGEAIPLDGTESVTLGADGSLVISDANTRGASISTTLASNGDGGVDVKTTASNVNLGGYLVGKSNAGLENGHASIPPYSGGPPSDPWPVRFPYGTMTTQATPAEGGLADLTGVLASEESAL